MDHITSVTVKQLMPGIVYLASCSCIHRIIIIVVVVVVVIVAITYDFN